jgi:uncharacterized protein YndB with AHSA1/START domain
MTDNKITVERTIEAPSDAVFAVLTDPQQHRDLDGAGFVQGVAQGDRITGEGETFTMEMRGDHMGGDYRTDNHVVEYDENRRVAWRTAPAGTEPKGWQWVWELEPQGDERTLVRHTYDWSQVTDEALLAKGLFPLVQRDQLEDSLRRLELAATSR